MIVDVNIGLIPEEILEHIFQFLDGHDLLATERVCRQWASVSSKPVLWRQLCFARQKGAASLIGYKIAIGGSNVVSKKRKADSLEEFHSLNNWKSFFFYYVNNNLFSVGSRVIAEQTLFAELQYATEHMSSLVRSNTTIPHSELIWLYSLVYCCQSQSTFEQIYVIYQDAVKSQCSEAWTKLCRRDGLEYLNEFVILWRNFTKYVDTLYSFFRCLEKKIANSNLKGEARSAFRKDVFLKGYEHAKECAILLSDSQDERTLEILGLVKDMFTSFGEPFVEFNQLHRTTESEMDCTESKPILFVTSDGTKLSGGEYLVRYSPVLRDILQLSGRFK